MTKEQPKIFLSYSHKNKDIAEAIDNDFQKIGLMFQRDVRDVGYMESFKKFMERIRDNGFALMIISDEYLKSENCMYEVLEFLKERDVQERILLIVLENTKIYDVSGKAGYIRHWKNKFEEINNEIRDLPPEDSIPLIEDLKKVKNINSNIGDFLKIISERKSIPLSELKENNYRAILDKVGFDDAELIEQIMAISHIEDIEDKEIALEKFLKKCPKHKEANFYRALLAHEGKEFKKALTYYNNYLSEIEPLNSGVNNNLAIILQNNFQKYEEAKIHYEKAIEINPKFVEAHYNLAGLLQNNFQKYEEGKTHYEKAIEINPEYAAAHYTLANSLKKNFQKYEEAKIHYEKAIEINPKFVEAQFGLAILLEQNFQKYEESKRHYEKAIEINPEYWEVHNNLAILLVENFQNYEGAKKHLEKAIEINPEYADAHNNLGKLLSYNFQNYEEAKIHYEKAIKINPEFAIAHNSLAILLVENFQKYEEAKTHYEKAIEINPDDANAHTNLAILLYINFQKIEEAKTHYEKAVEINPTLRNNEADEIFGIK
jgi:tetratricopeptide (TPR) repeat protein